MHPLPQGVFWGWVHWLWHHPLYKSYNIMHPPPGNVLELGSLTLASSSTPLPTSRIVLGTRNQYLANTWVSVTVISPYLGMFLSETSQLIVSWKHLHKTYVGGLVNSPFMLPCWYCCVLYWIYCTGLIPTCFPIKRLIDIHICVYFY